MLTSVRKMQLHSGKDIRIIPDTLSQRITANYGWILTRINPEELIHLVMEIPKPEGQPAEIVNIQYSIQNTRNSLMAIINQLINRLSLCQTVSFTYSDTVYVENILRKIGIQNPAVFIREIQQAEKLEVQRKKMLLMYRDKKEMQWEWDKWLESNVEGIEILEYLERRKEEPKKYFLQDVIYRRLQTASLTNQLSKIYQNNGNSRMDWQMLYLAEQKQYRELILLEAEKEHAWMVERKHSCEQRNPYEYMKREPQHIPKQSGQVTKQSIYSQMAAAILFHLTDQFFCEKLKIETLEYRQKKLPAGQKWTEVTERACSSAGISLERFFTYHREETTIQVIEEHWQKETCETYQKEIACMELLEQQNLEGVKEFLKNEIIEYSKSLNQGIELHQQEMQSHEIEFHQQEVQSWKSKLQHQETELHRGEERNLKIEVQKQETELHQGEGKNLKIEVHKQETELHQGEGKNLKIEVQKQETELHQGEGKNLKIEVQKQETELHQREERNLKLEVQKQETELHQGEEKNLKLEVQKQETELHQREGKNLKIEVQKQETILQQRQRIEVYKQNVQTLEQKNSEKEKQYKEENRELANQKKKESSKEAESRKAKEAGSKRKRLEELSQKLKNWKQGEWGRSAQSREGGGHTQWKSERYDLQHTEGEIKDQKEERQNPAESTEKWEKQMLQRLEKEQKTEKKEKKKRIERKEEQNVREETEEVKEVLEEVREETEEVKEVLEEVREEMEEAGEVLEAVRKETAELSWKLEDRAINWKAENLDWKEIQKEENLTQNQYAQSWKNKSQETEILGGKPSGTELEQVIQGADGETRGVLEAVRKETAELSWKLEDRAINWKAENLDWKERQKEEDLFQDQYAQSWKNKSQETEILGEKPSGTELEQVIQGADGGTKKVTELKKCLDQINEENLRRYEIWKKRKDLAESRSSRFEPDAEKIRSQALKILFQEEREEGENPEVFTPFKETFVTYAKEEHVQEEGEQKEALDTLREKFIVMRQEVKTEKRDIFKILSEFQHTQKEEQIRELKEQTKESAVVSLLKTGENEKLGLVYRESIQQIMQQEEADTVRKQSKKEVTHTQLTEIQHTKQQEQQFFREEKEWKQEVLQEQSKQLERMVEVKVQQKMHQQVNELTDKVYGKLERRLKGEKKRRGY